MLAAKLALIALPALIFGASVLLYLATARRRG